MPDEQKHSCHAMKRSARRRPYNQALNNVISLRISDDELVQLTRIREATSKSFSVIMRDALTEFWRDAALKQI